MCKSSTESKNLKEKFRFSRWNSNFLPAIILYSVGKFPGIMYKG